MTSSLGGGSHTEKRMQQTKSWRDRKAQMYRMKRRSQQSHRWLQLEEPADAFSIISFCAGKASKRNSRSCKVMACANLASHLGKGASGLKLELHLEGQGWIGTELFLRGESRLHVSISGRCLIPFCLAEASLSHLSDHQQNEDLLPSRSPQACVWLLFFGCGFSGSLPRSTVSYSQQYLKKLWTRVEIWRKYFSFPLNVTLLILVLIQTSDKPIR